MFDLWTWILISYIGLFVVSYFGALWRIDRLEKRIDYWARQNEKQFDELKRSAKWAEGNIEILHAEAMPARGAKIEKFLTEPGDKSD